MARDHRTLDHLPLGWVDIKFQDIVDSFKRGPFGSAIKKSFFVPTGFKVYEQQNVIYDDPKLGDYYIDEEQYKELEAFQVKPKDFLVSCSGTIGRITILPENAKPGVINQALLRIRINKRLVDSKFFLYLFRSEFFQKKILIETRGSAMLNIAGVKDLRIINLLLPPLAEQHRIVAKIEELFSDLDAGIASLKQAQAQLKTYRQAVLKYAFEGKLTAAWREQNNPEPAEKLLAQIKAEREKQYQQQLAEWQKADDEGKKKLSKPQKSKEFPPLTEAELVELPELPKGWRWVRISELAEIKLGKMLSKKAYGGNLKQLKYLRNQNIQWGHIDFSDLKTMGFKENEFERYSVKNGDLLVCEGGEPGRCAVYRREEPMMYQKALHRVRVCSSLNAFYTEYCLAHLIQNKVSVHEFKQTTIMHLPLIDFLRLPIPFCAMNEQHQIVQEIESRLSVCDKLEESIKESLQKAEALRQSILKKAFLGKLAPQGPNDEPAERLLERIRAEKTGKETKQVKLKI